MTDFINTILTFFTSVGHLLINIVTSVYDFIVSLPKYTLFMSSLIDWLPGFVIPIFGFAISLFIVKLILSFL